MATATEIRDQTAQLVQNAERNHTRLLWLQMARLNPPLPNPRFTPHAWEYEVIRPGLIQAGGVVTEQQAERREPMLVNPSRGEFLPE